MGVIGLKAAKRSSLRCAGGRTRLSNRAEAARELETSVHGRCPEAMREIVRIVTKAADFSASC